MSNLDYMNGYKLPSGKSLINITTVTEDGMYTSSGLGIYEMMESVIDQAMKEAIDEIINDGVVQLMLGALADIGISEDMNLQKARRKANRIYDEASKAIHELEKK